MSCINSIDTNTTKKNNYFFIAIIAALIICGASLFIVLTHFIHKYKENVISEGSNHLMEITEQIKIYIEDKIENDYKITHSIADAFDGSHMRDLTDIISLVKQKQLMWDVDDVIIYTQNGYCISVNGDIKNNDTASQIIFNAKTKGEFVSVLNSTLTYTVPIESTLEYKGSKIVAVSIVQDLSTFIDNMMIPSFKGEAWIYLTRKTGEKISQTSGANAPNVYNILSMLEGEKIESIEDHTRGLGNTMFCPETESFMLYSTEGDRYVVNTSINVKDDFLSLFYIVPENIVNKTMNRFFKNLMVLSLSIIGTFSCFVIIIFFYANKERKKLYDKAISSREHMFDLLVDNTRIAFSLILLNNKEPLFYSNNMEGIVGEKYIVLLQEEGRFCFRNSQGIETETIKKINEKLLEWNGAGEFVSTYIPYQDKGDERYFQIRIFKIETMANEFITIVQDVTQDFKREKMLKEAIRMADSANHAKSRFLANMSHDIRTPMNAIINMTAFAIEGAEDNKALLEYLNIISNSSKHLLRLINDILDMSKIESGEVTISTEVFDLSKCLANICEMVRPLYESKEQIFRYDFSGLLTSEIIGDRLKLSQVLVNLVNNAIKFTNKGGIIEFTVVELQSVRSEIASLRFSVTDNGMGINEEELKHIFEPFVRSDGVKTTGIEGTGLGLSICKSYVNAMGGTIMCSSKPKVGSTFTVDISFEKNMQIDIAQLDGKIETDISFKGKRALLCEDNNINRLIATKLLTEMGFEVEYAVDGVEGSNKFINSVEGYYDIIYMDIQMPIMDGYQAATCIRNSKHIQAKSIPIIAMTANVFTDDIEKSRVAGMNKHIGKPIQLNELISVTSKLLGRVN